MTSVPVPGAPFALIDQLDLTPTGALTLADTGVTLSTPSTASSTDKASG
jgi:hypothetical protein